MKITRATTYVVGNPWKNWLFVRLDTDEPGLYGVGEGTLNAFAKTVEAPSTNSHRATRAWIRFRSRPSTSG